MKDRIKGLIYLLMLLGLTIAFFLVLEKNSFSFGGDEIISFLIDKIDYLDANKKDKIFSLKENVFNIDKITNYEYRYLFDNNRKNEEEKVTPVVKEELTNKNNNDPIVYIYNTHQTEKYTLSNMEPHNIVPTVMTTSYMLKEKLAEYNINSIVEEASVSQVLNKNKWKYASSYKVTRLFLDQAKKDYPTLQFYIDVHRDSVKKKITTVEINKVSYARVMFLLGLENKGYAKNQVIIEALNDDLNKNYPGLSRGIYKKKGKGVNGVYNQDFSPNCILIEFGGVENTIDEVYNTVEIIGHTLAKYIGEHYES